MTRESLRSVAVQLEIGPNPAACQHKPPAQTLCHPAQEVRLLSPASGCCRAEGRALQAVKDPASPHRVANHNFGAWESWEVTSSGLVNLQWRHKVGQPAQFRGARELPSSALLPGVDASEAWVDI